jgi:AcrR family transcriptional regulator
MSAGVRSARGEAIVTMGQPRRSRDLMEKEILDRAAELFAQRGIAGTTLKDIAESLGISRPALYYYVDGKEALLERWVETLNQHDARILAEIRDSDELGHAEKLRDMATQLAMTAGAKPQQSRILSMSRHHLPGRIGAASRDAERQITRSIQAVIEAGIAGGEFRAVDPRTATMSVVGTCLWTAWWVSENSPNELETLARQIADQAVWGLLSRNASSDASPAALLSSVREDVSRLARLLTKANELTEAT